MTEFVVTLPVLIIIFAGILSLGRIGYETTKVKAQTQARMWEAATASDAGHISPRLAVMDGSEFATIADSIVTAGAGHWGESYSRVELVSRIPLLVDDPDPTFNAEDIIGESEYANVLVNDAVSFSGPSGGVAGVISWGLQQSGAVPHMGAGIRYGWVEGKVEDHPIVGFMGRSLTISARYRTLAPPETRSEMASWTVARLLAEGQGNYANLLEWNRADLNNESTDVPNY